MQKYVCTMLFFFKSIKQSNYLLFLIGVSPRGWYHIKTVLKNSPSWLCVLVYFFLLCYYPRTNIVIRSNFCRQSNQAPGKICPVVPSSVTKYDFNWLFRWNQSRQFSPSFAASLNIVHLVDESSSCNVSKLPILGRRHNWKKNLHWSIWLLSGSIW